MITIVLYQQLKALMIITISIGPHRVTVKYPKINHNIHWFSMSNQKHLKVNNTDQRLQNGQVKHVTT